VLAVEADAGSHDGLIATVGQLTVHPGAANVVPGEVTLSLDIRHSDDNVRLERTRHLLDKAREIGLRRNVQVADELLGENPSAPCAQRLASLLAKAVEDVGIPVVNLVSGAGHDGVAMASLTDVGMLFVRCKGGISHNPTESVEAADVEVAIDVLGRFLELLAKA
jgi:acetylornithine deacetylase/succinyl-diaminopimelate desuccinylase-like protein